MKNHKKKRTIESRRSFIKKGAMASSIFIVPRHVLGGIININGTQYLLLLVIVR